MAVDMFDPSSVRFLSVCVTAFFFVAIVLAGLWEKRRIEAYSVPEPGTEHPCTPYALQRNREAKKLGYRYGGAYHDARESIYKCRYDFWLSPDSTVLAWVSCGTIATLPLKSVNLMSQLEDGRYLQMTDMTGQSDLSGMIDLQIWPKLTFSKLAERHDARLATLRETPIPFSEAPLRAASNIRRAQAQRLVDQGDAQFVDDEQSIWKYTLNGALRFYFVAVWLQRLRRGLRKVGVP